jgi:hypothetical protein
VLAATAKSTRLASTYRARADIRYGGTATYHLRLPAGGGATGRLATARITKPFAAVVFDNVSVAELAAGARGVSFDGQPMAGDHRFDCSSTTLVLTIPPGGKLGGTWTFTRGGA